MLQERLYVTLKKPEKNTKVIRFTFCTVLYALCYQRTQAIDKQ